MDSAAIHKKVIRETIERYRKDFAKEYRFLLDAVNLHRAALKDPEFGEGDGDQRAMFEISERLQGMLTMALDEDGVKWFNSKLGGRWFAKTYKEFSLAQKQ